MSNKLDDTLVAVAEETMMSLAFLFLLSEDEAPPAEAGEKVTTCVEFSGPFNGSLFLAAPAELLCELAANMMGFDDAADPPSREVQTDALKELLNVVCGNLLPGIAGPEAVFKVHAPRLHPGDVPEEYDDQGPIGRARLYSESGPIELSLFIDNHALV